MKYCINCGAQINDNETVCRVCGAVQNTYDNNPYSNYSNQNSPVQTTPNTTPPRKSNTAVVAIIAVSVVIVAIIAAVAGVQISKNNAEPETVTVTVTQSTTAQQTEKETTEEKTTVIRQGNVYNYYYNGDGTPIGPVNPDRYDDFDLDYYEDWDYLFPSDTEVLTTEFLDSCSKDEIDLIRNEIYARHGYIFKKDKYYNYFIQKAWYNPTESSMKKVEKKFNSIEHKNIAILVDYQDL